MRVCNPIVRPLESLAETTAPTEAGFAEIVGDDFPIFYKLQKR